LASLTFFSECGCLPYDQFNHTASRISRCDRSVRFVRRRLRPITRLKCACPLNGARAIISILNNWFWAIKTCSLGFLVYFLLMHISQLAINCLFILWTYLSILCFNRIIVGPRDCVILKVLSFLRFIGFLIFCSVLLIPVLHLSPVWQN